jgi:hypothetical protein
MTPARHIYAAVLAFVGLAIVSANGAWSQSCKWEAEQMCTQWHWDEVHGGIPIHVNCPGGHVTCIPIITVDLKVNGYKRQGFGWHELVTAGPSPGRAAFYPPVGCTCDAGGFNCVCVYPQVATEIVCPNLANPGHTINCP